MSERLGLLLLLLLGGSCGKDEPKPGNKPDLEVCPPDSSVTWESFGSGFVQIWCTGCHSASVVGEERHGAPDAVNFDSWSEVVGWGSRIQALATPDNAVMPPSGGVTAEDRARLAEWIACEMPGSDAPAGPCEQITEAPGDLVIAGQADADAFCAGGANRVGGSLVLTAGVSQLGCLCEVGGDLQLGGAIGVSLPALVDVGGALQAVDQPGLTEVALPELIAVGAGVELSGNTALERIALPELRTVGAGLIVGENPWLGQLDLTRLTEVGGGVEVIANPLLADLHATTAVERIGGDVRITDNHSLDELSAFRFVVELGGDVEIARNNALWRVSGFEVLPEMDGSITVADNPALQLMSGWESAVTVGAVAVERNPLLTRIDGFSNLGTVTEALVLADDAGLFELLTFRALTVVGELRIQRNGALTLLTPFDQLDVVLGDFTVTDNPALPTQQADDLLQAIDPADVGGVVTISGNAP